MSLLDDRKAGYEAGVMTAGDFMKGKVVGFVMNGSIVLKSTVKLENGQYLLAVTKEELEELMKGKLPK